MYGVALLPLMEITRAADKGVLAPFYANDVALDGPADRNAQLLGILVKHGPDFGFFPEPEKSIHNCNDAEYVGGYIGDREREVKWVKTKI
eukprot:3796325-Ditylum_brightwellii.AAC.1